jgi:hypothetical protein
MVYLADPTSNTGRLAKIALKFGRKNSITTPAAEAHEIHSFITKFSPGGGGGKWA